MEVVGDYAIYARAWLIVPLMHVLENSINARAWSPLMHVLENPINARAWLIVPHSPSSPHLRPLVMNLNFKILNEKEYLAL